MLSTYFDNEEGLIEDEGSILHPRIYKKFEGDYNEHKRINFLKKDIISSIQSILENNHKVILVYSVPEHAHHIGRLILRSSYSTKLFKINYDDFKIYSSDYSVYKKRNKFVFETLDGIKGNIYRIYPEKHFCNTKKQNRCISNTKDKLLYFDSNHLSLDGAIFVVDDILETIDKITSDEDSY